MLKALKTMKSVNNATYPGGPQTFIHLHTNYPQNAEIQISTKLL